MKGIKECINWMLDNPMKEIKAEMLQPRRYNDNYNRFECYCQLNGDWFSICNSEIFEENEWEEVIQEVDFITAYKDCKETGQKYKCESEEQIMVKYDGCVEIKDSKYDDVDCMRLDVEWVKFD